MRTLDTSHFWTFYKHSSLQEYAHECHKQGSPMSFTYQHPSQLIFHKLHHQPSCLLPTNSKNKSMKKTSMAILWPPIHPRVLHGTLNSLCLSHTRQWMDLVYCMQHLLDPDTSLWDPKNILYPSKTDPSIIPIHIGHLERKWQWASCSCSEECWVCDWEPLQYGVRTVADRADRTL